jgi:hypothetical protein
MPAEGDETAILETIRTAVAPQGSGNQTGGSPIFARHRT